MKLIVFLAFCLLQIGLVLSYTCIRKVLAPNEYDKGVIYSPGYPNNYPADACFMWYHIVSRDTKVDIEVQDLDMPLVDNCQSNSSNRLIFGSSRGSEFCHFGSSGSRYAAVVSNYFYILMITKKEVQSGRGFLLKYELSYVDGGDDISSVVSTKSTTTTASPFDRPGHFIPSYCSFSTQEAVGIITLPTTVNSCGRYNGAFTWLLKTPQTAEYWSQTLRFYFSFKSYHFNLGCCSMDIYQGSDVTGRLVGHFYGGHHQDYFRVTGPNVFIKLNFRKDYYSDSFGNFTLEFQRNGMCRFGNSPCLFDEHGCFPLHKKCDGVWDCPLKGGDERNCPNTCPKGKFSCEGTSVHCYSAEDRCDGQGTCANYQDEKNCSPSQCSSDKGLFLCKNKRCIYEKWRCDHTNDCRDGSDEEDCGSISSSPRLIMACVVGTTISALLLVLTLSFVCRIYTMRGRHRRVEPEVPHDSPLSRIEEDLLRIRAPPPQYNEAMLTSRSYDEAYLELLNQGQVNLIHDNNPTSQDGAYNALPTGTGSGERRTHRSRRQRIRHDRNLRIQHHLQRNAPTLYLTEPPPGYSEENPRNNQTNEMELLADDGSHELQPLPIHSSSTDPGPPPYSLHQDPPASTSSSEDDDDDDDDGDEEDDYIEERDGEESCLLGGSDEEEDDTCLSIGLASESDHSNSLAFIAPVSTTHNPSVGSSGQVLELSLDKDEEEENEDKKEIETEQEREDESSSRSQSQPRPHRESSQGNSVPSENEKEDPRTDSQPSVTRALNDDDDDCECILSADVGGEEDVYDDNTTSDVACLIPA